eukprot:scaffold8991_cov155-Skeletonema_dohrnii-CCMP3373.AAC.18
MHARQQYYSGGRGLGGSSGGVNSRRPLDPEEDEDSYEEDSLLDDQSQEEEEEQQEDEEDEYVEENQPTDDDDEPTTAGDDAVLDLAELEQLQEEAERMKGLGNKHMAAQEYTRAYNAYSAALQLSPVGPSSHVFLSNRAASLLSLKRYSAAAVDARRAVALAPTFGKAHARLGQALYFLKQYKGAVEAYEDALKYEEEDGYGGGNNAVTRAYLQKAREKLAKQEEKERKKRAGAATEDATVDGDETTTAFGPMSVVTDKEGVGLASGMRAGSNERINSAARNNGQNQVSLQTLSIDEDKEMDLANLTVETGPMGGPAQQRIEPKRVPVAAHSTSPDVDIAASDDTDGADPDFDEALRLQKRATWFLSHKQYRSAVDEFTAALFLVPDDPILSPQLHTGRAHALNGLERFQSAENDALYALKIILRDREEDASAAEAYSVLGKSLYYAKDYRGAVEAFEECERVWEQNGGKLSVFDEAYLDQAHDALDAGLGVDHDDGASVGGGRSVMSYGVKSVVSCVKEGRSISNIPKLKPPRFVSREEALKATPNLPPTPKSWPKQTPTTPTTVKVGPEREVLFLSDQMGIKLNRGTDGIVRVISVSEIQPGSSILRKGKVEAGDLVREVCGVDLRRPITATMWGDTVALIKMTPRPVSFIVAQEITSTSFSSPRAPQASSTRPTAAEI